LGLLLEKSHVSSKAFDSELSFTDGYQELDTFVESSCMMLGVLPASVVRSDPFPDSLTVAYQYWVSAASTIVLAVVPSAAVNDVAVLCPAPPDEAKEAWPRSEFGFPPSSL